MGTEPGPMGWRVGRSLGRTIYHDNEFMGIMETAELAELIVTMLQEAGPGWDAGLFGDHLVRPREFHQRRRGGEHAPDPLRGGHGWDLCVCGYQWLPQSGRCVTQRPGAGS